MPPRLPSVALLSLLSIAGCGGGGGSSDGISLTASVTEAFVGERVDITLTLDEKAGGDGVAAWLEASEAGVLQLPAFVYVEPDETEALVEAYALRAAEEPVTVTADAGDTASVEITVHAHPSIVLVASTSTADQMSVGTLSWSGTASHARGLDPDFVTIVAAEDAGITFGAPILTGDESSFTLEVGYEIAVDAPPGVVELEIDTNGDDIGGEAFETLTIRRIPRVLSIDPPSATVDTTEVRPFLVTLDEPARNGGELVALDTGNADIADPGTEVLVEAGELTAIVIVEGVAPGGPVAVTASLADSLETASVTVADATVGSITVQSGGSAFQGAMTTLVVTGTGSSPVAVDGAAFTLLAPVGSGLTFANENLAGNHEGWTLTAGVTVGAEAPAGVVQLAFDANGAAPGSAANVPFTVLGLPRVASLDPVAPSIFQGDIETFTITLTVPARAGGESVTVTSATAGILSFASPVVVPEGSTSGTFGVTAAATGSTTLTASLNGGSDIALVTVIEAQVGGVILTEFVTLTLDTSNNAGEAIEVRNVSGGPIAINGWTLQTLTDGPFSIRSAGSPNDDTIALVLTGGQIAWGVPHAGTIPAGADFVWGPSGTTAQIGNDGDAITLRDGTGQLQDVVDFTAFVKDPSMYPGANDFPAYSQKSTQLDAAASADALTNDDGGRWCVTFRVSHTLGSANQSCSSIVINEVLYDSVGTDNGNTFIELAGPGGASVAGLVVRPVTTTGETTDSFFAPAALMSRRMPVDGFYVLADLASGVTTVAGADETFNSLDPSNSAGSSVQLVLVSGAVPTLLDVVRYGANANGITVDNDDGLAALEGTHTGTVPPGSSIARDAMSTDTDENSLDFTSDATPTPGAPNS